MCNSHSNPQTARHKYGYENPSCDKVFELAERAISSCPTWYLPSVENVSTLGEVGVQCYIVVTPLFNQFQPLPSGFIETQTTIMLQAFLLL